MWNFGVSHGFKSLQNWNLRHVGFLDLFFPQPSFEIFLSKKVTQLLIILQFHYKIPIQSPILSYKKMKQISNNKNYQFSLFNFRNSSNQNILKTVEKTMDKNPNPASGPKVSQIANLFQRKTYDEKDGSGDSSPTSATNVMRSDSHAARFNNARALFEKLAEGRINQSAKFSIKHSNSKDDNLKDLSPERNRSPSPKRGKHIGITNGVNKVDPSRIFNEKRLKNEKPEKPEKPERKFNSKELIEKQKNWPSHFPKNRSGSNQNRCDIIRAVPTGKIARNNELKESLPQPPAPSISAPNKFSSNKAIESPPSPSIRQSVNPPEIKPRTTSRSNSLTSPTKALPSIPDHAKQEVVEKQEKPEKPERPRKKSLDFNEPLSHSVHNQYPVPVPAPAPADLGGLRRHSNDSKDASLASPAHALSSSTSPGATGSGASSGPSSPIHTEDEKQENESNEKTDIIGDDAGKDQHNYSNPS
jgi:neurabin